MNLKDTLNLPKTTFPMKLDKAVEQRLVGDVSTQFTHTGGFILHDGPPFANGDIHLGHTINKVVKDITNRLNGPTNFRPGWDCHGLPIENAVKATIDTINCNTPVEFRNECSAYAQRWVNEQMKQFQSLGIKANWETPYSTMNADYEGSVVRAFAELVRHGLVYRKEKPVHWSIENQTALAVAELEYKNVKSTSAYVGFRQYGVANCQFLIWTTTPWTLPANDAIAVNKNADYVRVKLSVQYRSASKGGPGIVEHQYVLAEERAKVLMPNAEIVERFKGQELLGFLYIPPFERRAQDVAIFRHIYHADFVDTTTGTGIVHISASHGLDDFNLCEKEEVYSHTPVKKDGTYDKSAPNFVWDKSIWEANQLLLDNLKLNLQLFKTEEIEHEYPHDWRSKKPTIQLTTPQWFISMDKQFTINEHDEPLSLRERALAACEQIEFVPAHGKTRFISMLKSRPDWCISRQRSWGLPIPAYYDDQGNAFLTYESAVEVGWMFDCYGSNVWYERKSYEIVADSFKRELKSGNDTFDVWFESGASWLQMPGKDRVADVYLEGSDQHRGWFQHSLLLSLGVRGKAPFKKVVTHGFVVKPNGEKVSKSDPEYVRAHEMIAELGADPIRLWVASNDFQQDICASPEMLRGFVPKYNKVRNTLKYLVSNLNGFDSKADWLLPVGPKSLDAWLLYRLAELEKVYSDATKSFAYHTAVSAIFNFLNVDLSAIYANAMKDRLYCGGVKSPERRQTQTVMNIVMVKLFDMLEPFIPFTIAEAKRYTTAAVALTVDGVPEYFDPNWEVLFKLRDAAIAQLDSLKKSDGLNKATDAQVVYSLSDSLCAELEKYGNDLEDVVGCGSHSMQTVVGDPKVSVIDRRKDWTACDRSWKRREDVKVYDGMNLSDRDASAVGLK